MAISICWLAEWLPGFCDQFSIYRMNITVSDLLGFFSLSPSILEIPRNQLTKIEMTYVCK